MSWPCGRLALNVSFYILDFPTRELDRSEVKKPNLKTVIKKD